MSWSQIVPLLGTWQGFERHQDRSSAAEGDARAMISWKFDLGESIAVQDYRRVQTDGLEFAAHGVFTADGDTVTWWQFDTAGVAPLVATGGFGDGGELVLTVRTAREFDRPGRWVHRWQTVGDQLEYRVAYGPPGEETSPFLGGRYRRLDTH